MYDVDKVRANFPALSRIENGRSVVYFDGPGGTQVPRHCIDAMTDYLCRCNANHGGTFSTSVESDAIVADAHEAMADMVNAVSAEEIVFGANMTTLTFALARSLASTLGPGDEIVLTVMDHDANFSPWYQMALERGVRVQVLDIHEEDCTLRVEDLAGMLSPRTRLLAVGYASNAVGTINPIRHLAELAHSVGALCFVDAVHYAPHGPIDVQELGCDFLAFSPYKVFAPHLGVLWGRRSVLEHVPAYKVRPADSRLPGRLETGTQNHEALAGLLGTVRYLQWLGSTFPVEIAGQLRSERCRTLHRALAAAEAWEHELKVHMLDGLRSHGRARVYGITDPARLDERVPTFAIRVGDEHPRETARRLANEGIFVWDGHYYAINLSERLNVETTGGMVRIGLAHYNTHEEIDRLLAAL
jgi:cysteine desulfurase family protein (TIGR01976 family)